MEIPKGLSKEEKKVWWETNKSDIWDESKTKKLVKSLRKEKLSIPKDVRLVYLRIGNQPIGCFVTRLISHKAGDDSIHTMEFQYSAYCRKDRYDRSIGKALALERLEECPYIVVGTYNTTPYQLKYAATECLAGHVPTDSRISGRALKTPVRIARAAKEWLDFRDKTDAGINIDASNYEV
jgi:hypothetical protein